MFTSIGDSDEPLGRMLAALRFWMTKDLVSVVSGREQDISAKSIPEIHQRQACQAI
jgi:hypothetical protein